MPFAFEGSDWMSAASAAHRCQIPCFHHSTVLYVQNFPVLLTEPLDLLDLWAHRLRAVREPTRLQAL